MTVKNTIKAWFSIQNQEPPAPNLVNPKEVLRVANRDGAFEPLQISNETLSEIEDARLKFSAADSLEAKSLILTTHPFFQGSKDITQLDAPMLVATIEHMTATLREDGNMYYNRYSHGNHGQTSKESLYASRPASYAIIAWSEFSSFLKWTRQALEVAEENISYKAQLQAALLKHVIKASSFNKVNVDLLVCVELLAERNVLLPVKIVCDTFKNISDESNGLQALLLAYPALAKVWNEPLYDAQVLEWSTERPEYGYWLGANHPRINAWDIAETFQTLHVRTRDKLTLALADSTPSGALMKAWYGFELTTDEIVKHPLAHSLYVYKHAPMYLEEVKPLPISWEVALSLATTGRQFCDALIMTAKNQMNKETPMVFELPDMDASSLEHTNFGTR